uniref:Serine/threonine-protein kinase AFC1 n=1 Tax=Rhizophora mucronata TaxID=61149 RepID=A0A2P2LFC6_RHIMU
MMERVLGPLPQHMVVRADRRAEKYFRRGTRLDWPEGATSRESMKAVWKLPRLPVFSVDFIFLFTIHKLIHAPHKSLASIVDQLGATLMDGLREAYLRRCS